MPAPGESSGEPSGAKGGPAGENKKSRLAEWRARDYKFIRFLRISASDGRCGGVTNGAFGNLLLANVPLSLVCSFSHEIVNNFTGTRLCRFSFGRINKNCACPRELSKRKWAFKATIFVVPLVGLEPTRHCWQRILSPPRLPFQHSGILKRF